MAHIVGSALYRPNVSPDGHFLAIIAPEQEIHILSLVEGPTAGRVVKRIALPRSSRNFLSQASILRWSPEVILSDEDHSSINSELNYGTTWMLLSDGNSVKAISIDLPDPSRKVNSHEVLVLKESNILADYQAGDQFGKVVFAEFVFDHRHAILFFETGIHASVISFSRPQRDDIPNPKFSDSRGFSQSSDGRCFVLLLRSKGQDQVVVFTKTENAIENHLTFNPNTSDAQSIILSPNEDRLIAICDSSTYGTKVSFFTAMGHWLKHWEITADNFGIPQDITPSRIGVTRYIWIKNDQDSVFGLADGQKRVHIRIQQRHTLNLTILVNFSHADSIDGSQYPAWLEDSEQAGHFTLQQTAFEAPPPDTPDTPDTIDTISLNSDLSLIATKLSSHRKALWLWAPHTTHPFSTHLFNDPIKSLAWHPTQPHLLLILTLSPSTKNPRLYAWQASPQHAPALITIHFSSPPPPSLRWDVAWLDAARVLLSSPKAFELGELEHRSTEEFVLRSWLNRPTPVSMMDNEEDYDEQNGEEGVGGFEFTPTKPAARNRRVTAKGR